MKKNSISSSNNNYCINDDNNSNNNIGNENSDVKNIFVNLEQLNNIRMKEISF